jgi:phosphatidylglycerol---prolipoprotein diacylglyceryl transferase
MDGWDSMVGFDLDLLGLELGLGFVFGSPGAVAFQVGPLMVRWYGLLIAGAVLLGVSLSSRLAVRRGLDPDLIGDLAFALVLGAIPAARIYYVLFQWKDYVGHPERMVAIWEGGIAIHGAILGGMLAAWWFARWRKVSFWLLADIVAPALILGQAIGRWGNFFNSEAYGSPTDLPWKLFIPIEHRFVGFEEVAYYHPTFLYESVWNLMVFGVLLWVFFRLGNRVRPGFVFSVYAIGYSLGRLWIEGLRSDSLMAGGLKMAQVVSLTGIVLGAIGMWVFSKMEKPPKANLRGK